MGVLAGEAPEHAPPTAQGLQVGMPTSPVCQPPRSIPPTPLLTSSHRYFCQVFSGGHVLQTQATHYRSSPTLTKHKCTTLHTSVKAGSRDRDRVRARWKAHRAQLLTVPTIPQTVQGPAESREPHKHRKSKGRRACPCLFSEREAAGKRQVNYREQTTEEGIDPEATDPP